MVSHTEQTLNSLANKELLILWLCLFEQQGWVVESQLLRACEHPSEINSLRQRWLAQIGAALHAKHGHLNEKNKARQQGDFLFCLLSNARTMERRYANLLLLLAHIESKPEQLKGKLILFDESNSKEAH